MFAATAAAAVVQTLLIATAVGVRHDDIFVLSPDKNPRCHSPSISQCEASLYPINNYQVTAWFFHTPFKSCRPLYSPNGINNCTENLDLPLDKSQCEDLCGEPCKMFNGSDGICMLEEHCDIVSDKATANPRPCRAYNVKCCPRGYKSPSVPVAIGRTTATNTIDTGHGRYQHHKYRPLGSHVASRHD